MLFLLVGLYGTDALAEFVDQDYFFATAGIQSTNTRTILELYKASEITIYEKEPILESINRWTRTFLENQLLNQEISDQGLRNEVRHT